MGSSISAMLDDKAAEAETKEQLQLLHKMMVDKTTATSDQLRNAAMQDARLPVTAIVDTVEKYKVNVEKAPSKDVTKAMNDVVSGDFLGGVASLATVALNQILGNTSAGETQTTAFHIIFANNSLLRLDYMIYKYGFRSEGVTKTTKNAFCYYIQVAVLDIEKVEEDILLYELTKALNGREINTDNSGGEGNTEYNKTNEGPNIGEDVNIDEQIKRPGIYELVNTISECAKVAKALYGVLHELQNAKAPIHDK